MATNYLGKGNHFLLSASPPHVRVWCIPQVLVGTRSVCQSAGTWNNSDGQVCPLHRREVFAEVKAPGVEAVGVSYRVDNADGTRYPDVSWKFQRPGS